MKNRPSARRRTTSLGKKFNNPKGYSKSNSFPFKLSKLTSISLTESGSNKISIFDINNLLTRRTKPILTTTRQTLPLNAALADFLFQLSLIQTMQLLMAKQRPRRHLYTIPNPVQLPPQKPIMNLMKRQIESLTIKHRRPIREAIQILGRILVHRQGILPNSVEQSRCHTRRTRRYLLHPVLEPRLGFVTLPIGQKNR